jgi:uncharacterized protein (DUF1800 family)
MAGNFASDPRVIPIMRFSFRVSFAATVLIFGSGLVPARGAETPSETAKAAHALNRLGYGPRPGEVEKVAELGVEKWIRAQLRPDKIADPAAEALVAASPKLGLSMTELVAAYQAEQRFQRQVQQKRAEDPAAARELIRENEGERFAVAQALGELQHAKLARAVLSERQMEEVLVDFWFNHFNVDARKQMVRATVVGYERDAIRPHVFGDFRELLGATARSAAMLVYLDNWRSSKDQAVGPAEQAMAERMRAEVMGEDASEIVVPTRRGLNENYGRELLELHTLGVDGGYTQKDVQEVARALTGWTLNPRSGEFVFRDRWHDDGAKKILGTEFASGGGRRDGEKVLDLLAAHPATARHVARKLCRRFVADEPPERLVGRVAEAFLKSKGNLRATYEALFLSPEFFAAEHLRAKTKSPFEFVASALRASGAEFVEVTGLRGRQPVRVLEAGASLGRGGDRLANLPRKTALLHLVEMGQPLYAWGPPTGFPEDSSTWVSAGALVSRLNFSLALSGGQVADARVDVRRLLGAANPDRPNEVVDAVAGNLLGGPPSANTRRVLLAQAAPSIEGETAVPDVTKVVALLLGSPEFQRR